MIQILSFKSNVVNEPKDLKGEILKAVILLHHQIIIIHA